MAEKFILLPALTPQNAAKDTMLVRATRIWESVNNDTKQVFHTNVVLLDQEDNQILAMVRNTQKHNCFPLLSEGKVYRIKDVKLLGAPKNYRPVPGDKTLVFYHKTRILPTDDTGIISMHKFDLTTLENVGNFVNSTAALLDVIGMVTDYGNLERASNGAQKMDILLINEREKKMSVTLWEEKAKQFQDALSAAQGVPVFAVICGLLAKTFASTPTLSSTDATKCYININYNPLNELRDAVTAAKGKSFELLPPPAKQNSVAANANGLKELSIQQILEYQLPTGQKWARCLCMAEIVAIVDGEGWYYNSCGKCKRKLRLVSQAHYCDNCSENVSDIKQRYRLVIRVNDASGTTTFTLFNKEVESLVLVPIEKVISELKQGNPSAEIPAVLNNVIGKTCVFDIKIDQYNINFGYEEYVVLKLSDYEPEGNDVDDTDGMGNDVGLETDKMRGKRKRTASPA